MKSSLLWWLSCQAYKKRIPLVPRLLKTLNFLLYHAVLPYQAEIEKDIHLEHYGLGIVVHPNVTLGHRVRIFQHVTLAAETSVGSDHRIIIGDDVMIGAGAVVVARINQGLRVGNGAQIGANAVVTRDVAAGETVGGIPARPLVSTRMKTATAENEAAHQANMSSSA